VVCNHRRTTIVPDDEENKNQAPQRTTGETAKSSGDPGRTPSKAEGDEETVDEDIDQKLGDRGTQRG
jgi:hypothetical protein